MEYKKFLITREEKLETWGEGEWLDEPDIFEFYYKDFQCVVKRIFSDERPWFFAGHLCGYVKIPEGNIAYGLDVEEYESKVHGGITFAEKGDTGYWWGFDCAHYDDLMPSIKTSKERYGFLECLLPPSRESSKTYKNLSFCVDNCKILVDELVQMTTKNLNESADEPKT